jgi:hypothetical protein
MTTYIFTEWITKINKIMKLKKRKVLLFLDITYRTISSQQCNVKIPAA